MAGILLFLSTGNIVLAQTSWDQDANGNWFDAGNWTAGVPNASGAVAQFNAVLTADRTVTLDAPATVGEIEFDSAFSTIIAGSELLSFGGGALLEPLSGATNRIEVDIDTGAQKLFVNGGGAGAGLTLAGIITGTGGLNKDTDGSTLEILADNSGWSGLIEGRGGRLGLGHNSALGTGSVSLRGAVEYYAIGGDRILSNPLDGQIAQSNRFDGANGNNFTFSGNGTAGGVGHINGGNLTFTGDVTIGSVFVTNGTGVLRFDGSVSSASAVQVNANQIGGRVEFHGDNWDSVSETGLILGELRDSVTIGIGHERALGDPDQNWVSIRNVTFEALGTERTIANNIGIHSVGSGLGLRFTGDDHNITVTGNLGNRAVSQTGRLYKQGEHTLTLTGTLSYTLGTEVNAGTLLINGDATAATGAVTVSSGATLGGIGTIGGAATVNGAIAPGNSIGILTIANNVIWNGDADPWLFELGPANSADLLAISAGNFTKGTGSTFLFDFLGSAHAGDFTVVTWTGSTGFNASDFSYQNLAAGYSGEFAIVGSSLVFTAIPEPTFSTFFMGALGLGFVLRRRLRSGKSSG